MLPHAKPSRLASLETALIREVARYHEQFHEGMPMQSLSAKYARSMRDFGGFPEVIYQLETSGRIEIELHLNGRRTVKPKTKSKQDWF